MRIISRTSEIDPLIGQFRRPVILYEAISVNNATDTAVSKVGLPEVSLFVEMDQNVAATGYYFEAAFKTAHPDALKYQLITA